MGTLTLLHRAILGRTPTLVLPCPLAWPLSNGCSGSRHPVRSWPCPERAPVPVFLHSWISFIPGSAQDSFWSSHLTSLDQITVSLAARIKSALLGFAQSLQSCQGLRPYVLYPPFSSVHEFSRQENWSGLPFLPPGDLLDPGVKLMSPEPPALQVDSLPTEPPSNPQINVSLCKEGCQGGWMDTLDVLQMRCSEGPRQFHRLRKEGSTFASFHRFLSGLVSTDCQHIIIYLILEDTQGSQIFHFRGQHGVS